MAERLDVFDEVIPIPGLPTTGFNAHDGEVMATPRVFAIYWGRDYGSPSAGMSESATSFDGFLAKVMDSRYLDMLGQYLVGRGSFMGSTWIDHAPERQQTLSFDQMRDVMTHWLDDGVTPEIPSSNEMNLLFVIFAPREVTFVDGKGKTGFCGFHLSKSYRKPEWEKANLFFAVVEAGSTTAVVSHELAEAFTDRGGNGWYSDLSGGAEIGDVCNSCESAVQLTLAGFPLASYWLVEEERCLQQADLEEPLQPPPATVPNVVGETVAEAAKSLRAAGFVVAEASVEDHTFEHIGLVISQLPRGGSISGKGATVTIRVGVKPKLGSAP